MTLIDPAGPCPVAGDRTSGTVDLHDNAPDSVRELVALGFGDGLRVGDGVGRGEGVSAADGDGIRLLISGVGEPSPEAPGEAVCGVAVQPAISPVISKATARIGPSNTGTTRRERMGGTDGSWGCGVPRDYPADRSRR
ncbi:MAG: hypothetical protein HOU81_19390 [Hamadaea sp.]|nr:hypothetical protein [Hamadaea sp.]